MAAVDDEAILADSAADSSDDDSESSSAAPDELTGGSGAATAVRREPKVVGIGLDSGDAILQCPHLKDIVIVSRSDLTGPNETEAVLTGGWLDAPTLLSDIFGVDGRKFVQLQKSSPPLSAFFTGKHPRYGPLKRVQIFSQMKARLRHHCKKLLMLAENVLANTQSEANMRAGPSFFTSKVGFKNKKGVPSGKRSHHKKNMAGLLPTYDIVDMSFGSIPWSPTVLLRAGEANVSMEVTAANLQTLFNIVQAQIADPDALTNIVGMPQRKGRRPKGHEHAPIDSPRGKKYFIDAKGEKYWIRRVEGDVSGSTSSTRAKCAYVRISDGTRAGNRQEVKADKRMKTAEKVLGKDDDSISHMSHGRSQSEGP